MAKRLAAQLASWLVNYSPLPPCILTFVCFHRSTMFCLLLIHGVFFFYLDVSWKRLEVFLEEA